MNNNEIIKIAEESNFGNLTKDEQAEFCDRLGKRIEGIPEDIPIGSDSEFLDFEEEACMNLYSTINEIIDILNEEFGSNVDYYD